MPIRPAKPFPIETRAQLAALASSVRQEIIDAVSAAGPSTIARIAELVGKPADRLYFHIRRLEGAGLLRRGGPQRNGRHTSAVYDVPGRPMRLRYRPSDPANVRGVRGVFDCVLRLARRDFGRALAGGGAVVDGSHRNTWGGRVKGWVSPAQVRAINAALVHLQSIIGRARPRKGARPMALTFVLVPLDQPARRTRARKPKRK